MAYTANQLKLKTDADLSVIADELGLVLNISAMSKKQIIDEIIKAQEDDEAAGEVFSPDVLESPAHEPVAAKPKKQKKYRVTISNQEGADQTAFIKVGVNGYMYTLPREVEVVVPEEVIEVLNNAVVTYYAQEGEDWVPKTRRRFPFTVLGEAK